MVCVTGQKNCSRLIDRGKTRIAPNGTLYIVNCIQNGKNFLDAASEADAAQYLFSAAQTAGGELYMLRCDDVDAALFQFASDRGVDLIIMERGRIGRSDGVIRLQRRLPGVEFEVVE